MQPPVRSYLLGIELVAGLVGIAQLHFRVRSLELEVAEHEERLNGIRTIANRAAVVNEARKVVEQALTISLRERATHELEGDILEE